MIKYTSGKDYFLEENAFENIEIYLCLIFLPYLLYIIENFTKQIFDVKSNKEVSRQMMQLTKLQIDLEATQKRLDDTTITFFGSV